jgi:hypothetical protein
MDDSTGLLGNEAASWNRIADAIGTALLTTAKEI